MTTPATRTFEHTKTYGRLGSFHLLQARCTTGNRTSVVVILDRFADASAWTTLAHYPDSEAGIRAADSVARAIMRTAVEMKTDDDPTIDIT